MSFFELGVVSRRAGLPARRRRSVASGILYSLAVARMLGFLLLWIASSAKRTLASFEGLPMACCGRNVVWKGEKTRCGENSSLAYIRHSLIIYVSVSPFPTV